MQRNIFSPRVQVPAEDMLSRFFYSAARVILVVVFSLLPVVFVSSVPLGIGPVKAFFVVIGVYAALIFTALSILRSGKINLIFPVPIILFWLFACMSVAAALLSGDRHDSLFGAGLEIHAASFFVLLAVVMTMSLVFRGAKKSFRALFGIGAIALIVTYTHFFLRLVFGPEYLSFGVFNSLTTSLIGGLNDLAIYAGGALLILMLVLHHYVITFWAKAFAFVILLSSLAVLMVVNFSFVWLIIGFFSLLVFLYLISKDTWLRSTDTHELAERQVSRFTLFCVAVICLLSGAFIVSGDYLGTRVAALTGITYLEVRPSLTATLEITKAVYGEDMFFGIGPNRFEDAWRLHKNPVITETQFWNTNFTSGSGFVPTLFVTTGIVGTSFFLLFIGGLFYTGFRVFYQATLADVRSRTINQLSFTIMSYLWLIAFVYTPGMSILLLAAFATGLFLAVTWNDTVGKNKTIDIVENRQYGFPFIAAVLIVIIGATAIFIAVNKQVIAQVIFNETGKVFAADGDFLKYDQSLAKVTDFNNIQDTYVAKRAELRLLELNRLLLVQEPSAEEQKNFELLLSEGIQLAEQAIVLDNTNPYNYALLGSILGVVNAKLFEGLEERRENTFNQAKLLDPQNPEYPALQGQLAARFGEVDKARQFLNESLQLKSNYTDALFLLSQLDIQAGNATSAIATTQAIVDLDPYNPARYYQLGLLQLAAGSLAEATLSFEAATLLDTNYANARYMLALAYLDSGRREEALTQLQLVAATNPDSEELRALIREVESGDYRGSGAMIPLKEQTTIQREEDVTLTTDAPETDLVSPVNTPPRAEVSDQASQNEEQNNVDAQ